MTNHPLHILRVQITRREHRTFTITIFLVERFVFGKIESKDLLSTRVADRFLTQRVRKISFHVFDVSTYAREIIAYSYTIQRRLTTRRVIAVV